MRSDTRRSCHREHFNDKASLAYYALPSARAVSTTCSEIRNSSGLSFISLLWCKMHQRRQISFLSISNAFNFLFGFSQISNGTNVTDERRLQCIIPKFPLKKYVTLACSPHYVKHNHRSIFYDTRKPSSFIFEVSKTINFTAIYRILLVSDR